MFSNYKSYVNPTQAREPLRTYDQAKADQGWHIPPMDPDAFKARVFDDRLKKLRARRNRRKTAIRNEYKNLLRETDKSKTPDQYIRLVEGRTERMNEIDDLFDDHECSLKDERSRAKRSPGVSPESDVAGPRARPVRFETTAKCLETGMPVKPHIMGNKTWGLRQVQKIKLQKMRNAAKEIRRAERHMKASLKAYSRFQTHGWLEMHMDTVEYAQKCHDKFFDLVRAERERLVEPRRKRHRRHKPRHRHCHCRLRRDVNPVPDISDLYREAAQPLENPVHTAVNAGGSVEDNRHAAYNTGAHGQNVGSYGSGVHGMGTNGENVQNNYNGAHAMGTNANSGYAYETGSNGQNVQHNYNGSHAMGTNANYGYGAYEMGTNVQNVQNNAYAAYNTGSNTNYGYGAHGVGAHGGIVDNNAHAAYDRNAYSGSIENNNYAAHNPETNGGVSLNEGPGNPVYTAVDEYANVESYGYDDDMGGGDEDAEYDGYDDGNVQNNGHSASGMGTNGGASLNEGSAGRFGARHDDAGFSPSSPEMPTKRRRTQSPRDMGTNNGGSLNEGRAGRFGARYDDAGFSPSSPERPTKYRKIQSPRDVDPDFDDRSPI
ncbi:Phosphatidylinositol 3,4,5-trisphosphate-dependent Rac exchanger 2 protein [Pestalotiopsis sp. IQ-011]